MNATDQSRHSTPVRGETGGRAASPPCWKPLFLGDWIRAVFIHYEVPSKVLQPQVPFELDLREGRAFVSLVAFTMKRLRPRWGGRCTEWLFAPIAVTRYLNVRSYVVHDGVPGIYFLAEFLSNPLCVPLGPPTFGLPYRFGRVQHHHDFARGKCAGEITCGNASQKLSYEGRIERPLEFRPCASGSLEEFLMERYAAFTCHRRRRKRFRIWHAPWPQVVADVAARDEGLLATTGDWIRDARLVGANCSPGVWDVRMESPKVIRSRRHKRRARVFFEA